MKEYKTKCRDLEVLMLESKLTPLPFEDPNFVTFDPVKDDRALVAGKEYIFDGEGWIEHNDVN